MPRFYSEPAMNLQAALEEAARSCAELRQQRDDWQQRCGTEQRRSETLIGTIARLENELNMWRARAEAHAVAP
jgi:chromosome segregation ATPase